MSVRSFVSSITQKQNQNKIIVIFYKSFPPSTAPSLNNFTVIPWATTAPHQSHSLSNHKPSRLHLPVNQVSQSLIGQQ